MPRLLPLAVAFLLYAPSRPGPACAADAPTLKSFVTSHCLSCHDAGTKKGELNLAAVSSDDLAKHSDAWEKVVRRLRARQMPPAGKDRPAEAEYVAALAKLEGDLDAAYRAKPKPGRTETIRRLTRTEYQNAIRDLLAVDIDSSTLLPPDEASHGFDNVTVGELSPTLLVRYVSAAEKIAKLAVAGASKSPGGETIRIKPDVTQEDRAEGLPFGTRGGAVIRHTFPREGEYDLTVRLTRDRNELVEGLFEPHDLDILIDRRPVKRFTVTPPPGRQDFTKVDAHLTVRVPVTQGPHAVAVTFAKQSGSLIETMRQPYESRFNFHRHPRQSPAVYEVTVTGPYGDRGPGEMPIRMRILGGTRLSGEDDARRLLARLTRRAYRRTTTDADVERLMPFFRDGYARGSFPTGIESALAAVLVSRDFLFRVERDPVGTEAGDVYQVGHFDLASRLSFFLWSSLPDEPLLDLAERKVLRHDGVLESEVKRLLADPRANALATNFAGQWLQLRNLDSFTPDGRLYPDFDDNLRRAMRTETELHFDAMRQNDRSVLELISRPKTFLNERLAKHYGVPHIYGPRFREFAAEGRGGLLRQASVLSVTSYATRTSPVLRGKWVLETLLGTPPPPPPPNVPTLDDNTVAANLTVRDRLSQHRANAACATCHNLIDPAGFSLEAYDAVGRRRLTEDGLPVDFTGGLPDGSQFSDVAGLEQAVLNRPELFVGTFAEKLLTYALGRGLEPSDGPAVREIVNQAKANGYRFSSLVDAVVQSPPFRMRAVK
jgi:hypothetical protein